MIVLTDKPGQLCNLLWAYSPFIALAKAHRVRLLIPHFGEYLDYFENLRVIENVRFIDTRKNSLRGKTNDFAVRAVLKFARTLGRCLDLRWCGIYLNREQLLLDSRPDSILKQSRNIIFLQAWDDVVDNATLLAEKAAIVRLFQPKHLYRHRIDRLFEELRLQERTIVGVHVRRGDYANFLGGRYLFTIQEYRGIMERISDVHTQKKVTFYIASNDVTASGLKPVLQRQVVDRPDVIEDLYALSRCDYIVGPPSTFSMWASFIGDVPLQLIKRPDDHIQLERFSPILHLDVFRSGELLLHDE